VSEDGTVTEQLAFDDPDNFKVNFKLLKYLQGKFLPLSHVEDEALRDAFSAANPEVRLCSYESAQNIQLAHRAVLLEKLQADIKRKRLEGHKMGLQFDMWTRHGRHFACLNYTTLEMGTKLTDNGPVAAWVVKSAVLDFVEFKEAHTAANMEIWLNKTISDVGCTWGDFCLLVPDGASNCVATLKLLEDEVEGDVCACHDLARGVLTSMGMGAALTPEDKTATAELTVALKKMRTLAVKFHRVEKLKQGCHDSQKAAGIERELDTIKANITRWNGVYLGLLRNIQLKEHIVDSLSTNTKINVLSFDEEGEGVMVEEDSANLLPSAKEWKLAAESSVALEPAYKATQHLQGLKNTPDKAWTVIFNLHTYLANVETHTFKVPVHPSPGTTTLRYIDRPYADLLPPVRCMLKLLSAQVYNRFISKGPCLPCMLALMLNPCLVQTRYLTPGQLATAKWNLASAVDQALTDLADLAGPSSVSSSSSSPCLSSSPPASASSSSSSSSASSGSTDSNVDLFATDSFMSFGKVEVKAKATQRESEDKHWEDITKSDIQCGAVTVNGKTEFDVLVFWAHPHICDKFEGRARVFKGVYAAITHEATSESTFSGAGRAFNKQRTLLDPGQLCDTVACVSREKLSSTDSTEVLQCLKGLGGQRAANKTGAMAALLAAPLPLPDPPAQGAAQEAAGVF
jgi:hypothetical protein